jgi:LCP family protein required for cell wall assembly
MKRIQEETQRKTVKIKKKSVVWGCIGAVIVLALVCGGVIVGQFADAWKNPELHLTTPPNRFTPPPMVFATPDPTVTEEATATPEPTVEPTHNETTAPAVTESPNATRYPATPTPPRVTAAPIVTAPVETPPIPGNYVYNENLINILVMGVDTIEGRVGWGYHSDVIMLLSIDKQTMKTSCISVPRDTKAVIDRIYQRGDYTELRDQITTKINAAFAQGGGASKQSYQNTIRAVSRLMYDIPIDFYIGIDMNGVGPVVNALGGVKMTIEYDFTYYDKEMVKGRTMVLNGSQALHYLRQRHHIPDSKGADLDRTARQRAFIRALAKQIKEQGNAVDLAMKLYQPFLKYIDTDLSLEQTVALASMLMHVDMDTVDFRVIPGWTGDGEYYTPYPDRMQTMVIKKFYVLAD